MCQVNRLYWQCNHLISALIQPCEEILQGEECKTAAGETKHAEGKCEECQKRVRDEEEKKTKSDKVGRNRADEEGMICQFFLDDKGYVRDEEEKERLLREKVDAVEENEEEEEEEEGSICHFYLEGA